MSDASTSPPVPDSWSARIADRYGCQLSPQLADWFDNEVWRHVALSEYREPVHPSVLLGPAPGCIWPALMPCDLLPIISNTAGDWLCVRVDQHDVAADIVQWYHGGGDWIPWGTDLAEALFLDAVIDRLPGASSRHAIPAENPRPVRDGSVAKDPVFRWAMEHLPSSLRSVVDGALVGQELAEALLEADVAEIAVRCELILADLSRTQRQWIEALREIADDVDGQTLARWAFDNDQIPRERRERFKQSGLSLGERQDWKSAAIHAQRVTELTGELSWAWDTVGYAAEHRGDLVAAKDAYGKASQQSVFTDQSIRLETHWTARQAAKFSAARLLHHFPEEVAASRYLSALCDPDAKARRRRITSYWSDQAVAQLEAQDFATAHRSLMASGWDVGADPIECYGEILERIATVAEQAGQISRSETARTHRRCLQDRYGV